MKMPRSCQNSFEYKLNQVAKPLSTGRIELTPIKRAFAVSAITSQHGDYDDLRELTNTTDCGKSTLSELMKRIEKKVENLDIFLWNRTSYENDLGCGKNAMLTSSCTSCEKESWQAIAHGDFDEIVPAISVITLAVCCMRQDRAAEA